MARKAQEITSAVATIKAAFAILGSKALVMLSLLAAIGAFAWALYEPTGMRLASACLVTVLTFLPALWIDWRRTP